MNRPFEQALIDASAVAGDRTHRQAALLLHAMTDADRHWALTQLDARKLARVTPLLDQLVALGVPADAVWLDPVRQVPESATTTVPSVPNEVDAIRARVASADPMHVAEVLSREPEKLVRLVMHLGPWSWGAEVLALLRARRGQVFEPAVPEPQGAADAGSPDTNDAASQPPLALAHALLQQLDMALASTTRVGAQRRAPNWRAALQRGFLAVSWLRGAKSA